MSGDFDVLIIGSGFGGSVSALRLAEKGCTELFGAQRAALGLLSGFSSAAS